jgi:hypothetical protein
VKARPFEKWTLMATVVLTLLGCGGPGPGSEGEQPINTDKDDWSRMKTFAQSLTALKLRTDTTHNLLTLSYGYRSFDGLRRDGSPEFAAVTMAQKLLLDVRVRFDDPNNPRHFAHVRCGDGTCSTASIELTKATGELAGEAVVRYQHRAVDVVAEKSKPSGETAMAYLAGALNGIDPLVEAKAHGYDVQQGLRDFFELTFDISNALKKPADVDYFDYKRVSLSGEIGPNVPVDVLVLSVLGPQVETHADSTRATVTFDPAFRELQVRFADGSTGLVSLTATAQ